MSRELKIELINDYLSKACQNLGCSPVALEYHPRKSGKIFKPNLISLPKALLKREYEAIKGIVAESLLEALALQKRNIK